VAKRKSTGKRQRFNIFKRDRFTCQYCGRTPPDVILVIDHILPVAAGGGEEDTNKITACEVCNQGKSDGLLTEVPRAIDKQLAEQVERQEQLAEYNQFLLELRKQQDSLARELGTYWCDKQCPPNEKGKWTFGDARLGSVMRFLTRLPITEIYEAIDIAYSRKKPFGRRLDDHTFRYFCGICWSKIKQREGVV
jgi:hypothetical protein